MTTVSFLSRAMRGVFAFAALGVALVASPDGAAAQDRLQIGYGRLTTNDSIGEFKDRWQTSSQVQSRIWGPDWTGTAPLSFGQLIEFRSGARIIAPEGLRVFDEDDRRFAGILSFGLHTHASRGASEVSLGGDLVIIGEQTRLDQIQTAIHDIAGIDPPSKSVLSQQIDDQVRPTLVAEAGQRFALGSNARLRPFVETRAGAETYARIGADLTFGQFGAEGLMVREEVTGQRYEAVAGVDQGFSFTLGGDIAQVFSSVYLPDDEGPELESARARVRAGMQWRRGDFSVFYGTTYLSEEFEGQGSGQFLGSARIRISF